MRGEKWLLTKGNMEILRVFIVLYHSYPAEKSLHWVYFGICKDANAHKLTKIRPNFLQVILNKYLQLWVIHFNIILDSCVRFKERGAGRQENRGLCYVYATYQN